MRIGIVGSSGHYSLVTQSLPKLAGVRIAAVAPGYADEDMSILMADLSLADQSPCIYETLEKMLEQEDLHILVTNTAFHLNAVLAKEGLRRQIPVFSEKPLALDLEMLDSIKAAQAENGTKLGMMLNFRYDERFHTARQFVQQGVIGEPLLGYSQKSYKLGKRPDFFKRRESFGGLIPWVGVHAIDWFSWVSGVGYKAVSAFHANLHAPEYEELEDVASCIFELSNGGTCVMNFDYLRPLTAPTHGDDRLRLVGSEGTLEISDFTGLMLVGKGGQSFPPIQSPPCEIFEDFVLSVKDPEHKCLIDSEDVLAITETILRARESADKRCRIVL